jgi:hypothetical protein
MSSIITRGFVDKTNSMSNTLPHHLNYDVYDIVFLKMFNSSGDMFIVLLGDRIIDKY